MWPSARTPESSGVRRCPTEIHVAEDNKLRSVTLEAAWRERMGRAPAAIRQAPSIWFRSRLSEQHNYVCWFSLTIDGEVRRHKANANQLPVFPRKFTNCGLKSRGSVARHPSGYQSQFRSFGKEPPGRSFLDRSGTSRPLALGGHRCGVVDEDPSPRRRQKSARSNHRHCFNT